MAEPLKQAQAYAPDGSPIAASDMAAAVREGRALFQKGAKVYARNPDGALVSVAAEEAATPGYQVLSQGELHEARLKQQAESASGLVKTGAEGAARGATLGFLGPEQFYDAEGREAARARQKYNPNLSAGSEVAGALGATIAASALSGGAAATTTGGRVASLAARGALTPFRAAAALGDAAEAGAGALRLGEGLLGTAAKFGARGAAEGALMGVGHEVSEAALDDVPLTAERLLAGAWDGAKAGGAFGLGLGVLGHGVGKAGRAIVGRMSEAGDDLGKATGTWAERATFKQQVGNQGKLFDQATKFGKDPSGPARIGRKLLDADMPTAAPAALKRAEELRQGALARMQGVVKAVDDAGVTASPEAVLRVVDDQIAKIREVPFGDAQAVADRIERNIAPFRERFGPKAVPIARAEPVSAFDGVSFGGPAPSPGVELLPEAKVKLSDMWGFRKALDDSINFEVAQRGPAKQALMDMRSAFVGEIDDTIARAAETSGMDPQLLKAWKTATEDYGDFALIKDGLKGLIKQRSKNRAISPSDYAAGGLMSLLSGGNPLGGMAMGAASAGVHKLIRERGLGVMAKIADRQGGVAARMESAGKMAAMVEKAPKRLTAPAVSIQKTFERYSEAVNQANADPVKFSERMAAATADLSLRAPEVASQIQKTMLADLAYLNQLHPTPATRKNNTLTPMAKAPEFYAFDQKRAFVDAAMALDNPVGVFEQLAEGKLPLAGLQALKARRPLLFSEMQRTVIKYTSTREAELPYSRRVLLGTAFDFAADWSMLHVGEIQESLASGDPSGKPNDPTAAPSKVNKDPGADINPGQF